MAASSDRPRPPRWPHPGPLRSIDEQGEPAQEKLPVDRPWTVVTWNTAKGTSDEVREQYRAWLAGSGGRPAAALLLLQEARPDPLAGLPGRSHFAHSWRGRGGVANGVLTHALCATSEPAHNLPSPKREFAFTSHKNGLVTTFPLEDGRQLCTANVHGINFRATPGPLRDQLGALREHLGEHRGPMILAGDFNTWQRGRLAALYETARALGLRRVRPPQGRGTSADGFAQRALGRAFSLQPSQHLDHLFVRGLTPALPEHPPTWDREAALSDHVPLVATLRFT